MHTIAFFCKYFVIQQRSGCVYTAQAVAAVYLDFLPCSCAAALASGKSPANATATLHHHISYIRTLFTCSILKVYLSISLYSHHSPCFIFTNVPSITSSCLSCYAREILAKWHPFLPPPLLFSLSFPPCWWCQNRGEKLQSRVAWTSSQDSNRSRNTVSPHLFSVRLSSLAHLLTTVLVCKMFFFLCSPVFSSSPNIQYIKSYDNKKYSFLCANWLFASNLMMHFCFFFFLYS